MKLPFGSVTNTTGELRLNGDPVITVGNPVVGSIEYPVMSLVPWSAMYTYWPAVETAIEIGPSPVANGDPVTSVSAPLVESSEKIESVSAAVLATYTNLSAGSTAMAKAPRPTGMGTPAACNTPVEDTL